MNNKLDIESHIRSFAETFVLPGRRDKWIRLLCERPDTILSQSSRLFNYLDHNYIEQNDSLNDVSPDDTLGVFYDFINEPECISFTEAIKKAKEHEAIFSIQPGKLAVYFLLDGWKFVCRK